MKNVPSVRMVDMSAVLGWFFGRVSVPSSVVVVNVALGRKR